MRYVTSVKTILLVVMVSLGNADSIEPVKIIGEILTIQQNAAQIKVETVKGIHSGDKVRFYYKTSFGDKMEVGEGKVEKVDTKMSIVSVLISDMDITPTIDLVVQISSSPTQDKGIVDLREQKNVLSSTYTKVKQNSSTDSQYYVYKAKKIAKRIEKNRNMYSKDALKEQWNQVIDNIEKAIQLDDPEAYWLMAMIYEDGYGDTKRDLKKMIENIVKSAEKGYVEAQYALGEMYKSGDEVVKDREKAVYWLKKAVAQRHKAAKKLLDKLTRENRVKADKRKSSLNTPDVPALEELFDLEP